MNAASRLRRPTLTRRAAALTLLVALSVSGCTSGGKSAEGTEGKPGQSGSAQGATASGAPKPPKITALVDGKAAGKTTARLDAKLVVSTKPGKLTSVVVTGAEGAKLKGALTAEGTHWESARAALPPATTFRVKAVAVDAAGVRTSKTFSFKTLKPKRVMKARVAPLDGDLVGVGHPVVVYFTERVTDRAAVEQRLKVTADPAVEGAWHWFSDTEVHYRPPSYWAPGTEVTLNADIAGVNAGLGTWGVTSRKISFRIGDSRVSKVSAADHTMKVFVNGQLKRTIPVSTGRQEFPTSSGVHVVMSKSEEYWMDSATIGIPRKSKGGYYKKVLWNVRISNSGEFVHSAPWSLGDQGRSNVSHGCVNASPADAKWFYEQSLRGDVVEVAGTPRRIQQGNGFADWNMGWELWRSGSAL